ncbi:hypothetical protein C8J57DRAFT_1220929 [Mycena rebaudengoi]|nr:hypothetical protein C8J57DRAFT_1220929 [Mycena rebaudengoi]
MAAQLLHKVGVMSWSWHSLMLSPHFWPYVDSDIVVINLDGYEEEDEDYDNTYNNPYNDYNNTYYEDDEDDYRKDNEEDDQNFLVQEETRWGELSAPVPVGWAVHVGQAVHVGRAVHVGSIEHQHTPDEDDKDRQIAWVIEESMKTLLKSCCATVEEVEDEEDDHQSPACGSVSFFLPGLLRQLANSTSQCYILEPQCNERNNGHALSQPLITTLEEKEVNDILAISQPPTVTLSASTTSTTSNPSITASVSTGTSTAEVRCALPDPDQWVDTTLGHPMCSCCQKNSCAFWMTKYNAQEKVRAEAEALAALAGTSTGVEILCAVPNCYIPDQDVNTTFVHPLCSCCERNSCGSAQKLLLMKKRKQKQKHVLKGFYASSPTATLPIKMLTQPSNILWQAPQPNFAFPAPQPDRPFPNISHTAPRDSHSQTRAPPLHHPRHWQAASQRPPLAQQSYAQPNYHQPPHLFNTSLPTEDEWDSMFGSSSPLPPSSLELPPP